MSLRPLFMGLALLAVLPARAETASPEIKRVYLSQGEWLGSALSPSGRELIADAASGATATTITQIDINGLADIASTPSRQKRISDERLAAARAEFVRLGIPDGDIGVEAVTTSDGSDPALQGGLLARRVVIVVHY